MKAAAPAVKAPCPKGSATPVEMKLMWRDENYGRLSGVLAFRPYPNPLPPVPLAAMAKQICDEHGFEFDVQRASLIHRDPDRDTPADLVRALQREGFTVTHGGCVPAPFACHPDDAALLALQAEYAAMARTRKDTALADKLSTITLDQLRSASAGHDDDELVGEVRAQVISAALALALLADQ